MNSIAESILILVTLLFKRSDGHRTHFAELLEGPFQLFLGVVAERTLKRHLMDAFQAAFGKDVISRTGRGRKVIFRVENKYWLDEANNVTPMDSSEFDNIGRLDEFASGSKVAFRRKAIQDRCYLHVGLLLRGRGNEPNVILHLP